MSEIIRTFHKIKLNLNGNEDLDLQAFKLIEDSLGRSLSQVEKAGVRFLLDQDQASRNAIMNKTNYDEDKMKDWV